MKNYKFHQYIEKPRCTCNHAELIDPKGKYRFPKSTTHSRKCECFWYYKIEARLRNVEEYYLT